MTTDEFAILAGAMKAVYTDPKFIAGDLGMETWYTLLKDIDYKVATSAIQKWMQTEKAVPTVADIRRLAAEVTSPEVSKDWDAAWGDVMLAIRYYGYYRELEAIESLDPVTARCVRRLGFKELCMSENQVADRANFRMIYEQEIQKQRTEAQMPEKLKTAIADLQRKMQQKIEGGHTDEIEVHA